MTRKTFLFSLMIALVALGGLAATATTADSAVQLPETVQAASTASLEQTDSLDQAGQALNLEPASQVSLSGCTRAECFQQLLLCDATCASYPPNDQPLCYDYCDEQFMECIASCG
jgi:hypothetical protein